jgi:hypothetical protein
MRTVVTVMIVSPVVATRVQMRARTMSVSEGLGGTGDGAQWKTIPPDPVIHMRLHADIPKYTYDGGDCAVITYGNLRRITQCLQMAESKTIPN